MGWPARLAHSCGKRDETMATALVTGGSGFLGSHIILRLLAAGHRVRTTVRSLARERDVRTMLRAGGAEPGDRLTFHAADLERDAAWSEAVAGCDYVMHVASPFPATTPRNEDDLIIPAREGTLRVLRASREAGTKRVVLTSSFAAIGYGHPPTNTPFDESAWTDLQGPDVGPYMKSKTLAERAAWDFVAREGGGLELSVINPVAVFGPVLGPDYSTSVSLIHRLLSGGMPGCPRLYFGVIDVRDVADLHLLAMSRPEASGERFIATSGDIMSIRDIARTLREHLGAAARRVPALPLPDWVVRVASLQIPALRQLVPQLGKVRRSTSAKAGRMLGWAPRPNTEALVASAESLLRLGLV